MMKREFSVHSFQFLVEVQKYKKKRKSNSLLVNFVYSIAYRVSSQKKILITN